jgi:hypothetical protein
MADVQTIINSIDESLKDLQNEAEDALGKLEDFATTWSGHTWVDFGSTPLFSPAEIPGIDRAGIPELQRPTLPSSLALEPQVLERYNTHVWSSGVLDDLQAKLIEFVETGGTGISLDVQDAIFNADKERQDQVLRDAMDRAGARSGARGFRYPNSMTKAMQSEILQKWQFDMRERSREITRLIADLAQKNVQFAIAENIKVETLHSDFALRYAGLFQNITAALVDKYRAETSAYIAEYEAETRYVLSQVDVAKANSSIKLGEQQLLLRKWETEVTNATNRTKALISQAEQQTQLRLEATKQLAVSYVGLANTKQANAIAVLSEDGA